LAAPLTPIQSGLADKIHALEAVEQGGSHVRLRNFIQSGPVMAILLEGNCSAHFRGCGEFGPSTISDQQHPLADFQHR
jgi:hypothetical protein